MKTLKPREWKSKTANIEISEATAAEVQKYPRRMTCDYTQEQYDKIKREAFKQELRMTEFLRMLVDNYIPDNQLRKLKK